MDSFFITTYIIARICFVILFVAVVGYLLSLKNKSAATWWLSGYLVVLCFLDMGWEIYGVIPYTQMSRTAYHLMFILGQGLFVPIGLTWAQFAYTFWGNPYPKEARWMLWVTGAVAVLIFAVILFTPSYVESGPILLIQVSGLLTALLLCTGGAVVFARKAIRFSKDAATIRPDARHAAASSSGWAYLLRPRGQSARACRAFVGVSVLVVLFLIGGLLAWGLEVFTDFAVQFLNIAYLVFLYVLMMAYVNHAPEPTTVQVKVVGAALTTMLLFIVILSRVLFPDVEMLRGSGLASPDPQTLRFEPDGQGGYVATSHPPVFDDAFGERVALENTAQRALPLPFSFPYYEEEWNSLYLNDNGLVSFGSSLSSQLGFTIWPIFHTRPLIAPLGTDLNKALGGTVYFKTTPDAAIITWHEVPSPGGAASQSVQLALHRTGVIAINYGAPGAAPMGTDPWYIGLRGLIPGGSDPLMQDLPRTLDGPVRSTAGAALVEDYAVQYYRHLEKKGLPLFYIVLAATLFILFVFPYVFRNSLLKPLARLLEGVRRVEAGETDTVVAVEVQDEIGDLTQHFNGMAFAVREAETQLQAYAETLEQKVEDRTAELKRSLEELKAAQAQLIQAEKMASLGQLTAGIAHEIKNPLNFVNNFSHLSVELADDIVEAIEAHRQHLPEDVVADLEELLDDLKLNTSKIHEHGCRADGIVESMLDHARSGDGERRATDVNALLDEYLNLAYHGMRANTPDFNVTLERDYGEAVGAVEMAPQEIGRVLINLLNNAFYAVHQHSLSHDGPYTPTVSVSTRRVEGWVEICVEDNGPGIAEGLKEKIFEPFFTTKPTGSGTGLGLSLSYDIVTQGHGGTMTVESEEGRGATFVVTLPVGNGTM